jgi:redox-sensitive bicupin YhaK (pirin superfamily)
MGPARFAPGRGLDVRPHPHIGLATVTWLFEGALLHRDSLGSRQVIRPGDVNWMTAGCGIVHSERTPAPEREAGHTLHGVQTWLALPARAEEVAPAFEHWPAASLPRWREGEVEVTVVAGDAFGRRAPAGVFSPTLYCALRFEAGAGLAIGTEHAERALYAVTGALSVDGDPLQAGSLGLLTPGREVRVEAREPSLAMLLGGAPLDAPRHISWNFVSSRRERIAQAERDWSAQRMGGVPGETDWIPLP